MCLCHALQHVLQIQITNVWSTLILNVGKKFPFAKHDVPIDPKCYALFGIPPPLKIA